MNRPANPTSAFSGRQPPLPPCRSRNVSNSNKLSKTTVKVTNMESLPDELLFDILACLPAEFLHDISRLVCLKWRRIIHSDAFANRQIQHSAYGLLVSSQLLKSAPRRHSIYAAATQGRIETYDLSDHGRTTIIGCCHGLALELHHGGVNGETLNSLHIMNPSTKKSFLLPSFSAQNTTCVYHDRCGIGYSAASMKYKVTLPYKHVEGDHQLICLAILTIGVDKCWRHVDLLRDLRKLLIRSPLTSEGFLHWAKRGKCLTLNVETEIFTTSAIPTSLHQRPLYQIYEYKIYYYLSTGRYLSLLIGGIGKFCWDVWEMKQNGEWRKLEYKIDLEAQKVRLQQFATGNNDKHLFPVGWVKYPEILVFRFPGLMWRNCIFYNLDTHEINTIELHDQGRPRGGYKAFVHRKNLLHMV